MPTDGQNGDMNFDRLLSTIRGQSTSNNVTSNNNFYTNYPNSTFENMIRHYNAPIYPNEYGAIYGSFTNPNPRHRPPLTNINDVMCVIGDQRLRDFVLLLDNHIKGHHIVECKEFNGFQVESVSDDLNKIHIDNDPFECRIICSCGWNDHYVLSSRDDISFLRFMAIANKHWKKESREIIREKEKLREEERIKQEEIDGCIDSIGSLEI